MTTSEERAQSFGGGWTRQKLALLTAYLDAYTTALKNREFSLVYIDAFAGSGDISLVKNDQDAEGFIDGSARLAIDISEKPFDRLIFVDSNPENVGHLQVLKNHHPGRDIRIERADANNFLLDLLRDARSWRGWRGVLFLDPFATELEWATVEVIASAEFLDTWILFPTSAITRILPLEKRPDDVNPQWAQRLTRIYGGEEWRELYRPNPQYSMFEETGVQRESGEEELSRIYQRKLNTLFGQRYMDETKLFLNSKNSPLFEFIFCVGSPSPAAIRLAKDIAGHILDSAS